MTTNPADYGDLIVDTEGGVEEEDIPPPAEPVEDEKESSVRMKLAEVEAVMRLLASPSTREQGLQRMHEIDSRAPEKAECPICAEDSLPSTVTLTEFMTKWQRKKEGTLDDYVIYRRIKRWREDIVNSTDPEAKVWSLVEIAHHFQTCGISPTRRLTLRERKLGFMFDKCYRNSVKRDPSTGTEEVDQSLISTAKAVSAEMSRLSKEIREVREAAKRSHEDDDVMYEIKRIKKNVLAKSDQRETTSDFGGLL